jgi:NDP-sugar pyrophosphorylase family protein
MLSQRGFAGQIPIRVNRAMDRVRGVVLAGTYPRGNSIFDHLRPRPLLPVALTPLVAYPLRWLWEAGVPAATVCTNAAAGSVRTLLMGVRDLPLDLDFYEDLMPRGSGGCVRDAAFSSDADTFVVVDGTAIPCVDLEALLLTHRSRHATVTVLAHGEKAHGPGEPWLVPGGVYIFDRRAFDFIPDRGFQDIKETLVPYLHQVGEVVAVHTAAGACPRIFNTETYLAVNHWMVQQVTSAVTTQAAQGYGLFDETLAHASVWIAPGARLIGPIMLGPEVVIAEGATIVGPTTIGPGGRIGAGALVSRSVLWNHCTLGDEVVLDRCLVADDARVPARTTLFSTLHAAPHAPPPHKDAPTVPASKAATNWNGAVFPFPAPSWRRDAA